MIPINFIIHLLLSGACIFYAWGLNSDSKLWLHNKEDSTQHKKWWQWWYQPEAQDKSKLKSPLHSSPGYSDWQVWYWAPGNTAYKNHPFFITFGHKGSLKTWDFSLHHIYKQVRHCEYSQVFLGRKWDSEFLFLLSPLLLQCKACCHVPCCVDNWLSLWNCKPALN